MQILKIPVEGSLYRQARGLRFGIFFEPLGLPESVLDDPYEAASLHLAAVTQGTLSAYGRVSPVEPDCDRISQMVVARPWQGWGLGGRMLEALLTHARRRGAARVILDARLPAQGFYERLGFVPRGLPFPSPRTGLPHQAMIWSARSRAGKGLAGAGSDIS